VAYTFTAGALGTVVASGNISCNYPASPQSGDIFVAFVNMRGNVGCSTPSGWTKIHESLTGDVDTTNGAASAQVFWMRYAGTGSSVTFSRTGGDRGQAVIIGVRGCIESGDPVDASNITTDADTALGWPNVTASSGGDPRALLAFGALGDNLTIGNLTSTTPSGGTWTEVAMTSDNTGADGGGSVFYHDVGLNAGATSSTLAATASGASTAAVLSTVALKPQQTQTIAGTEPTATAAVTVATAVPGAVTLNGIAVEASAAVTAAGIGRVIASTTAPSVQSAIAAATPIAVAVVAGQAVASLAAVSVATVAATVTINGVAGVASSAVTAATVTAIATLLGANASATAAVSTASINAVVTTPIEALTRFYQRVRRGPHVRM
jgi:hypothetical protein